MMHIKYALLLIGKRKEGNVLFTTHSAHFILRLYGIGHMVKYHSDSERNSAAATWATLYNQQQGFFYMHHRTDMIAPVVEHWLE